MSATIKFTKTYQVIVTIRTRVGYHTTELRDTPVVQRLEDAGDVRRVMRDKRPGRKDTQRTIQSVRDERQEMKG